MGRPKGTPKSGGRQIGSKNVVNSSMKSWLSELLDQNKDRIKQDLDNLDPKDRLTILEKYMQYTIPKMQSVEASVALNELSDIQLNTLIEELTRNID